MTDPKPPFWRHWLAWLVFAWCWLLAHLPRGLLLGLGRTLGRLFRYAFPSRKRVIQRNIAACFPNLDAKAQQRLIHQNYLESGMMVSQTLRTFLNRKPLYQDVPIQGQEHLQACLQRGQGVLLVSGHFTALDVGGRVISERFPVAGVYRPHNNPVQEYVVKKSRLNHAIKMFSRDQLKGIVKHLKSGGIIWYAPDQDYRRGQSIFTPFFGTEASTITATHQLARMTGCAVLFFGVKRIDEAPHYELQLSQPLTDFPSKDVRTDTRRVNQGIEALVEQAPAQYLWLHKRFKTRPDGEPPFYD